MRRGKNKKEGRKEIRRRGDSSKEGKKGNEWRDKG